MKYTVSRDQANEHGMNHRTEIAIWDVHDFTHLKMDEDGEWAGGDVMIDELSLEGFEKEYGITPPKSGSKMILVAEYSWE